MLAEPNIAIAFIGEFFHHVRCFVSMTEHDIGRVGRDVESPLRSKIFQELPDLFVYVHRFFLSLGQRTADQQSSYSTCFVPHFIAGLPDNRSALPGG
jgi:hypothetical protein